MNQQKKKYYYLFLVQSPNKTPGEITIRTEKFIKDFVDILNDIPTDEIETMKECFISSITSEFNNLSEMSSFIFRNEIENEYLKFDYREAIAKYCKKITLKDLIEFYNDKFIENKKQTIIQIAKSRD